ncbi:hypothetical protein Zmor_023990 [Zophobas morio]|uniref:Uncharacterized protein n=1 Tax=Zophobas morio TaxID=2755281 RepID=A0AA38M7M2_9CUCU|nr:hypothetical protein Zmor_023990 [Zophobas morio]
MAPPFQKCRKPGPPLLEVGCFMAVPLPKSLKNSRKKPPPLSKLCGSLIAPNNHLRTPTQNVINSFLCAASTTKWSRGAIRPKHSQESINCDLLIINYCDSYEFGPCWAPQNAQIFTKGSIARDTDRLILLN